MITRRFDTKNLIEGLEMDMVKFSKLEGVIWELSMAYSKMDCRIER